MRVQAGPFADVAIACTAFAVFAVADPVREESREAIRRLHEHMWKSS